VQVTLCNQRLTVASKKYALKIAITDEANSKGKEFAKGTEREREREDGVLGELS